MYLYTKMGEEEKSETEFPREYSETNHTSYPLFTLQIDTLIKYLLYFYRDRN